MKARYKYDLSYLLDSQSSDLTLHSSYTTVRLAPDKNNVDAMLARNQRITGEIKEKKKST